MPPLVVAIHGILTSQTDPSWPDRLDAWMYRRDPRIKVLKKEYSAGPFPRWNCWVKDPRLARALANELELFLETERGPSPAPGAPKIDAPLVREQVPATHSRPALWFVAHSNGAVIALLTARRLIARGYRIGGLILTGAACEANLGKNRILEWLCSGALGSAIAYCSKDDAVLDGALPRSADLWSAVSPTSSRQGLRAGWRFRIPAAITRLVVSVAGPLLRVRNCEFRPGLPSILADHRSAIQPSRGPLYALHLLRVWLWGKLMWPYGCLGRTGWLLRGQPLLTQTGLCPLLHLSTRWFAGGHCAYFNSQNIEATFEQIYQDIMSGRNGPSPQHWNCSRPEIATHLTLHPQLSSLDPQPHDTNSR